MQERDALDDEIDHAMGIVASLRGETITHNPATRRTEVVPTEELAHMETGMNSGSVPRLLLVGGALMVGLFLGALIF